VVFTLSVSSDVFSILLYTLFSFAFTIFFYFIKAKLYSESTPQQDETEDGEHASKRYALYMILALILGLSSLFLLSLFVDPLIWFLIITSFMTGINIPEVILYIQSTKSYPSNKK